MEFRWNDWNVAHIGRHGVLRTEAEEVVRSATRPYLRRCGGDKWFTWGRTVHGRLLQVIYVFDPDEVIYVLHARPLSPKEKHRFHRERR